jgi:hypothetical protein
MRIIFTGRDNAFNRRIVNYFSTEHEVVCCLFLEPERASWKGKLNKIKGRIKKYGLVKVLDQLAFHLFDRFILRKNESIFWKNRPEYCDNFIKLDCPIYQVNNINGEHWVELCNSLSPDIILATCSHVIFKPSFYKTPLLGTYVIHEGLTPEYKGLHTPLWALMKKEPQYVGYTVLKVNDKIDGGEILLQDTYSINKDENYRTWGWIGHNAIISGLENIKLAFRELEKKKCFIPVNKDTRKNGYYTWMGLSNFLRLYFKNYWRLSTAKESIKFNQIQETTPS